MVVCLLGGRYLFSLPPPNERDTSRALTEVLAASQNLSASPSDVFWIDPAPKWWGPWDTRRAWVLAGRPDGLDDVYLVATRTTPEGHLVELENTYNLTDTKATGERLLAARGDQAAWLSGSANDLLRFTWADLHDDPLAGPEAADFSRVQRLQWRLTWLQETGQLRGVSRHHFKLIPPASAAAVSFSDEAITLATNHGSVQLSDSVTENGAQHLAPQPHNLAKPSAWLTWSVDRLRATSWFGDENMQRLKAVVYRVWDIASRRLGLGVGGEETELELVNPAQPSVMEPRAAAVPLALPTELRRAWPPPRLAPLLTPVEPGEGEWLSLQGDPFIKPHDDADGLFVTTFLRTDAERSYARIIITAWDPLTVELHTMSGTEEPKSATGETGPGLVPRDPHVIQNLVGAFNGGFQTTHGDFGMMAEGVVYVPPLPFAATVATDVDGRVGFGTWPENAAAPSTLTGLRQNLTPLVANGAFNPYQRTWWGGVPSGWEDDTRTVRSGICLTGAGLVAYFYGAKVDAENLAKAMSSAGCSYGLHLDMNQGHTGLEFYHVAPEAELPPLALTLDHVWQAEGPVPEAPGYAFRGRRMFRAMQLMNFPRYIQRETRDFFYLTRRETLPRKTDGDRWTVPSSIRDVYPPPLSVRSWRPEEVPGGLVQMLELAPRFVSTSASTDSTITVASLRKPTAQTGETLYWTDGKLTFANRPPTPAAVAWFDVADAGEEATAMVCIRERSGTLLYAEIANNPAPSRQRALLTNALTSQGCSPSTIRQVGAGAFEVGGRDLSGHPSEGVHPRLHLGYRRPVYHFALFPETPVVAPSKWKPLQSKPD